MRRAQILRQGLFDMQCCVPKDWTDAEVEAFANNELPLGDTLRWEILPEGHPHLDGDPQRNQCAKHKDTVHVKLEC